MKTSIFIVLIFMMLTGCVGKKTTIQQPTDKAATQTVLINNDEVKIHGPLLIGGKQHRGILGTDYSRNKHIYSRRFGKMHH
jgi:starvation-inducible outer membrane lipoprotein